jgi:hypothetical protein
MGTFSSGNTIANQLNGIQEIINFIPDNSTGVIVPKNFRDGYYTLWENTIFKPTTATGLGNSYIGIDQNSLVNNDVNWYPKIYLGPKSLNSNLVMTSDLLGSDVDIFFQTMKDTSGGNYDTKVSFLAGSSSYWRNGSLYTPYIQSKVETTIDGDFIDFNIYNPSYVGDTQSNYYGGNVNISSDYGYVSINSFNFPKSSQVTSSNEGKVLRYRWISGKAYGFWEDAYSQSITSMASTGTISIVGSPVLISGYRFSDSRVVATSIGGIQAGETFSDVEVLDLLRRIIYTYVQPTLTTDILLNNEPISYIEAGDSSTYYSLNLHYTITRNATYSITFFDFATSSPAYVGTLATALLIPDGQTTTGTVSLNASGGPFLGLTQTYLIQSWTLSLIDSYPTTKITTSNLKMVLPFYHGVSTVEATYSTMVNSILGTGSELNKLTPKLYEPIVGSPSYEDNKYEYITSNGVGSGVDGKGFIYFGYPSEYPELIQIVDQNGFQQQIGSVSSDFYTQSFTITSPNGWWSDKEYLFYISSASTSVPISYNKWQFIFATAS